MADPKIPETLSAIQQHFFTDIEPDQLRQRIKDTEQVFREVFVQNATPDSSIEIWYFPTALHYSFVLINETDLYLSVYEQFRGPVIRSSVFHLDLRRDKGIEEYWIENLRSFLTHSRKESA